VVGRGAHRNRIRRSYDGDENLTLKPTNLIWDRDGTKKQEKGLRSYRRTNRGAKKKIYGQQKNNLFSRCKREGSSGGRAAGGIKEGYNKDRASHLGKVGNGSGKSIHIVDLS